MSQTASDDDTLPVELFEEFCRAAATRLDIPTFCRCRKCRRNGFCSGKFLPCGVPLRIAGCRGLETWLPLCIVGADDLWMERFVWEWRFRYYDYIGPPTLRLPEARLRVRPLYRDWPSTEDGTLGWDRRKKALRRMSDRPEDERP